MSENTGISWTDCTFNPWWGCVKVSAACKHCYAETLANRLGVAWGASSPRRFFGAAHWREPRKWHERAKAEGVPRFVFCASMCDIFEAQGSIPDETWALMQAARTQLWALIEETPWLTWLLLTKRPDVAPSLVPERWMAREWPGNAWAGATMESQADADRRAPALLSLPAPMHFASYEPAVEAVDFSPYLLGRAPGHFGPHGDPSECPKWHDKCWCALDWVIVGGESGARARAREFDVEWARAIIRQCRAADAAPFVKQIGARPIVDEASRRAGLWAAMPGGRVDDCGGIHLADRAGADPAEWLEELRVQERPPVVAIETASPRLFGA